MDSHIVLFVTTAVILILVPGPDMLFVATRGISQGRNAALISTFGICVGYFVHTIAALLGLSALIASSTIAFVAVKYMGAAYLVYLGIKTLNSKESTLQATSGQRYDLTQCFTQGLTTSLLNPKGILFYFTFVPQFINPEVGNVPLQLLGYGLAFGAMCALVYGTVGVLAGLGGERLRQNTMFARIQKWLSGTVLIGLGVRMVIPEGR